VGTFATAAAEAGSAPIRTRTLTYALAVATPGARVATALAPSGDGRRADAPISCLDISCPFAAAAARLLGIAVGSLAAGAN